MLTLNPSISIFSRTLPARTRFGADEPAIPPSPEAESLEAMESTAAEFLTADDEVQYGTENLSLFKELSAASSPAQSKDLKNRIATLNQPLVENMARKWWQWKFPKRHAARGDSDYLDMVAEGNVGLSMAIEKFDLAKGCKFSTYACWWINQALRKEYHQQGKLFKPLSGHSDKVGALKLLSGRINEHTGERPTDEQTVAYYLTLKSLLGRAPVQRDINALPVDMSYLTLGVPIKASQKELLLQCLMVDRKNRGRVSLDQSGGGEASEESTMHGLVGDKRTLSPLQEVISQSHEEHTKSLAMTLLESLADPKDVKVLAMRMGLCDYKFRFEEIGALFSRTRARIDQVEKRAMKRLQMAAANPPYVRRSPLRAPELEAPWQVIRENGMACLSSDEQKALVLFYGIGIPAEQIANLGGKLRLSNVNRLWTEEVEAYIQQAFEKVAAGETTLPPQNLPGFFNPHQLQGIKEAGTKKKSKSRSVPETAGSIAVPITSSAAKITSAGDMLRARLAARPVPPRQAFQSRPKPLGSSAARKPDEGTPLPVLARTLVASASAEPAEKKEPRVLRKWGARRVEVEIQVPALKSSVETELADILKRFTPREQLIAGNVWRLFDELQPNPEALVQATGLPRATLYRVKAEVMAKLVGQLSEELRQRYVSQGINRPSEVTGAMAQWSAEERQQFNDSVCRVLGTVPNVLEANVVRDRLGLGGEPPKSLKDLAQRHDRTEEWVRSVQKRVIAAITMADADLAKKLESILFPRSRKEKD